MPVLASPPLDKNQAAIAASMQIHAESRRVYLGGFPIGLSIKTDGVLIVSVVPIETEAGTVMPSTSVRGGDVIQAINDQKTDYVNDIIMVIKNVSPKNGKVKLKILRDSETVEVESALLKEELTGAYKLGFAVKDSVAGVGTVSFVKPDGSFGCLGHAICDSESGAILSCSYGNVYGCKILGYNRGQRGKAGELKGVFSSAEPCGVLFKNLRFGVYGKFSEKSLQALLSDSPVMEVGGRDTVRPGKAQIVSTIENTPQTYDIEIVRAMPQSSPDDRSMILRVTDKRLLSSVGGIVQGMSGSPIIQGGKIVGAVTHVFINDPTKGYGIYADWMYDI